MKTLLACLLCLLLSACGDDKTPPAGGGGGNGGGNGAKPHDEHDDADHDDADHEDGDHDDADHDDGDHDDGDHGDAEHGRHDGVVTALKDAEGNTLAYGELKLHDDKGDLELWLTTDEAGKTPYDVGMDAAIAVAFTGKARSVLLTVRNEERNEDEADNPNVRDGKTNYFIFPTPAGEEDASWLQGAKFKDTCVITVNADVSLQSDKFTLVPHGHDHGDDAGHSHD